MFGFDADMIFRIPALLIALTIHEYSHARMAVALGDPTPKHMGRLTLNPIAHLDPIGLIMLWLFKFGWAKPVEVNPYNFSDYRKGMMLVSLAGPVSNVLLAFATFFVIAVLHKLNLLAGDWVKVLYLLYSYNLILAVFNMIPIPPLDGSKVLSGLFPSLQGTVFNFLEQYGTFVLLGLIYIGFIGAVIFPIERGLSMIIQTIVLTII